MKLVTIPAGTRGFDTNAVVSLEQAQAFARHGYGFACRYLPRNLPAKAHDLQISELQVLVDSGLAVMPVQHVDSEPWFPSKDRGVRYGAAAVVRSGALGILPKTCVWLDLEGVAKVPAATVIEYCQAWYREVLAGGFTPGIYIGWHSRLTASDMYYKLSFQHYWAAYNLNKDEYPAVRGVQMQQREAKSSDYLVGVKTAEIDTNVVLLDAKGGLPLATAHDSWGDL